MTITVLGLKWCPPPFLNTDGHDDNADKIIRGISYRTRLLLSSQAILCPTPRLYSQDARNNCQVD